MEAIAAHSVPTMVFIGEMPGMYNYKVTVISRDPEVAGHISNALGDLAIAISGQYQQVAELIQRPQSSDVEVFMLHLPSADSMSELEALGKYAPGQPIVIVTSLNDSQWIIRCVRLGAVQIVVYPLDPEDVNDAMAQLAKQLGLYEVAGRIISVAGAQGGCGATFVACNLAAALSEIVPRGVLLADMNVNFGAVASYLDIEPRYSTLDLLVDEIALEAESVKQAMHGYSKRLKVLAAPSDAIGMRRASPQRIKDLLEIFRSLGQLVVLDVPCTYDTQFFTYLSESDKIVMIMEAKVPVIRAMKRVYDRLKAEGVEDDKIMVVINRDGTGDPDLLEGDIVSATGLPIAHRIPNDYGTASTSMNLGRLLARHAPTGPLWGSITELAKLTVKD
jgi:pilus assembly protein CpaE